MRYSLPNISQDTKDAILADVFLNNESGFLNGVNLSTSEGKQQYIDAIIKGKNPFKKDENVEDAYDDLANINSGTITWADILRRADDNSIISTKVNNQALSNPFSDIISDLFLP